MKRQLFLSLTIVGLLLTACKKDDTGTIVLSQQTVSASLPETDVQTRTSLNGLQVVWNTDDAITVFAENGQTYSNNKGEILTGVGTTSATFEVVIEGTTKVAAVYPYMEDAEYEAGKISMTLPTSYTYIENGIGGAPMAALISDQTSPIAFKNAGALMGLTVNNIPAGYNKAILKSNGEKAIAGPCEISFDDGKPTIKATDDADRKEITINFDAAQTATNKTFYFPIPVGNYSELELSISNGIDVKVLKKKGLNAERSMRYKTTLTLDVVSGETPVEANGAVDATSKLASGSNSVNVTITEGENNPTIKLPSSDNSTSLSFESIPEGKTVTIQETTDGADVSEQVTISASSDDNSNNSFNINLPNSTVTLNANGEVATYNEVTAATADETLIIGKGVTVSTLIIRKGHVRVYGKVKEISRDGDQNGTVTYLIKEEGAEIPTELGENIQDISAAEWDLRKIAENGGEITLNADVELTQPITIAAGKTVIVNLGGKTISGTATNASASNLFTVNAGANLTIKNGTIWSAATTPDTNWGGEGQPAYPGYANNTISNRGTLTINNAKIENKTAAGGASYVIDNYDGGSLIVNSGEIIQSGDDVAIRMFASSANKQNNVTINGGTVTGKRGVWIQLAGSDSSVAPCVNLTITNGTLTGSLDRTDNILAIYSYSYGNDMKNVKINISGGTFNGDVALTGGSNKTNIETLAITGGTFNGRWGDVYSYGKDDTAAQAISIKGGNFSSISEIWKYVGEEESAEIKLASDLKLEAGTGITIQKGAVIALDLNDKTISQEKECTESYDMILNKGTLTIKDTSSEGNGKISFKDTSKGDPSFGWGSYTIRNEGTLTVENGTIEHLGEQEFATHMICAIFQYSGSSTINGGVISTPAYRSARLWKGDMTITNGTFDGQLWVQSVDDSAERTISGGTFSPNGKDGSSVFIGNVTTADVHHSVDFNVTGGNFQTKIGCNDPSKLTGNLITGGVFTEAAKTNTNSALIASGYVFESNTDGTWSVVKQ